MTRHGGSLPAPRPPTARPRPSTPAIPPYPIAPTTTQTPISASRACWNKTPQRTQREIAAALGISLGQTNFLLKALNPCRIFIVTVPTPVDEYKRPDLTSMLKASATVGQVLKPGDLVIYESTVYPGCTEEDCAPVLEKWSGLRYFASPSPQPSPTGGEGAGWHAARPGKRARCFATAPV